MSCGCNKMVGGSLASDMVMENVKSQHDEKYDFLPSSNCGDVSAYKGISQTAGSLAKSMIKRHKKLMRHSKTKKNTRSSRDMKKSKSRRVKKSRKSRKPAKKSMSMMGGGSDWISSQYSQGPLNDDSDFSKYFSSSSPSSKGMLRNPPNLASAGSGAPMDFFGAGSPL